MLPKIRSLLAELRPWSVRTSVAFASREPTPIASLEDLFAIEEDLDGDYVLESDFDLARIAWRPLGDVFRPFTGTLDGNGHTLGNLTCTTKDGPGGLFVRNDGTIRNLFFEAPRLDVREGGTVAGWTDMKSRIEDVHVTDATVRGLTDLGGLVGINRGEIANCTFWGHVEARVLECCDFGSSFGGISGRNGGRIEDCDADGSIVAGEACGGIAGTHGRRFTSTIHDRPLLTRCSSSMILAATGTAGGIAGMHVSPWLGPSGEESIITQCFATGSVTTGSGSAGGLVGLNRGLVVDSYATGDVSCTGEEESDCAGGLIGTNERRVLSCYAIGFVGPKRRGGGEVGGLVGEPSTASGVSFVGDSYWNVETSGRTRSRGGGIGVTSAQLRMKSTFDNWDIRAGARRETSTWHISDGATYPQLFFESEAQG